VGKLPAVLASRRIECHAGRAPNGARRKAAPASADRDLQAISFRESKLWWLPFWGTSAECRHRSDSGHLAVQLKIRWYVRLRWQPRNASLV